jgi:hypothetical protein
VSDELYDMFKERLFEFGFKAGVKVEFSLGYSQGDGVAFYGEIDFLKWVAKNEDKFTSKELKRLKWLYNEELFHINIGRNTYGYHYSHAYTMECLVIEELWRRALRDEDVLAEVMEKLQSVIKEQIVELSKDFEHDGYEELEYHESNEYIRDMILANGYEFTSSGGLF